MRNLFALCLFAGAGAFAAPAAAEPCAQCPRVQLLRADDQIRIAAQDDVDPYESLRHRVRFITAAGSTTWSPWADTNAYGLVAEIAGQVEAESIDLDGNVGRAIIHITPPADVEEGSVGPRAVEEDSTAEARWSDDATVPDGTATSDPLPPPPAGAPTVDEFLSAESYDHSVCPVGPTLELEDDGPACTTARPASPPTGFLLVLLTAAALLLGRAAGGVTPRR